MTRESVEAHHVKKKQDATLPKTNIAPENIPKGNWYSNHPFSGAMLVSGRVNVLHYFFLGNTHSKLHVAWFFIDCFFSSTLKNDIFLADLLISF